MLNKLFIFTSMTLLLFSCSSQTKVRSHRCSDWINQQFKHAESSQIINYIRWSDTILESWHKRMVVPDSVVEEIVQTRYVTRDIAEHYIASTVSWFSAVEMLCSEENSKDQAVDKALINVLFAHMAIDKRTDVVPYLFEYYDAWRVRVEESFHIEFREWRKLRPNPLVHPMY